MNKPPPIHRALPIAALSFAVLAEAMATEEA